MRRKVPSTSAVKRQTYCAVERPEQQIKGFFEETSATATTAPVITSSSFSLKDSNSPTVFVGIIPRGSDDEKVDEPFDLLSVHKDGRVRRLAPDLKTQRWSIRHSEIASLSPTSYEVSAGFLLEFDDVQKSLFKRRPDLAALALSDVTSPTVSKPSVLLLVLHPAASQRISLSDVKIQIFAIPAQPRSDGFGLDEAQKLRHIHTVHLPHLAGQEEVDLEGLQWNFHSGSAGLSLAFKRGFINFDLSQYSPSVTSQFLLDDEQFSSVMRISPHSVIGAGKSVVALYDTQYCSIQRSIAVRDILSNSSSKDADRKAPTIFVGYFAKLGIALATKGNVLLAFDLSSLHTAHGSSLKRQRDGLLIDAIGRGIGSSAASWDVSADKYREEHMASLGLVTQEDVDRWNRFKTDLESSSKSADAVAFDNAVKSYFGSPSPREFVNPERVLFVLSKIFAMQHEESSDSTGPSTNLAILFWPKDTCEWLIKSGSLSTNNIDTALRRAAKPRILPPLLSGALVRALARFDPSLKHLTLLLKGPAVLDPEELTHALKIFLDLARARSAALDEPAAMTITNTPHGDIEIDPDSNEKVADPPAKSSASAEASLEVAFIGLNLTLTRLHKHPLSKVVASFRSTLSNTDTLSVIHHLRVSLATGGYTSRFTEEPPIPIDSIKATPPLSLNAITDLLNASVDAIGPSGWISAVGFAGSAANEADVIAHMKSEISAALAGVEEATYIKGILREFIRYAGTVVPAANAAAETSTTAVVQDHHHDDALPHVKREKLNGADLLRFAIPEDGYGEVSGKMLPLSLKAGSFGGSGTGTGTGDGDVVSRTKVKPMTGEVKQRTSREIGYLRRKAVGKYSFERLIV